MKKEKFMYTPWFAGIEKPVHPGVYERKIYGEKANARWDGKHWSIAYRDHWSAASSPMFRSSKQSAFPWRGRVEKP